MATNILLGIGNPVNGDDGAGTYVAERFRKEGWIPLSCGTAPENFTGIIRKTRPGCLVLVDAAAMGLSPGEYRVIPRHRISDVSIGTHQLPLSMLIDFVADCAGRIVLIGIQPDRVAAGEEISARVREGADRLVEELMAGRIDRVPVLK
ncbi:MAG: hydrogenase maturation peptidase HycI [Methanoregula sp.]|nr:MAG: hydrogenase maturation peptidase HycI [Methanoregula sp.]